MAFLLGPPPGSLRLCWASLGHSPFGVWLVMQCPIKPGLSLHRPSETELASGAAPPSSCDLPLQILAPSLLPALLRASSFSLSPFWSLSNLSLFFNILSPSTPCHFNHSFSFLLLLSLKLLFLSILIHICSGKASFCLGLSFSFSLFILSSLRYPSVALLLCLFLSLFPLNLSLHPSFPASASLSISLLCPALSLCRSLAHSFLAICGSPRLQVPCRAPCPTHRPKSPRRGAGPARSARRAGAAWCRPGRAQRRVCPQPPFPDRARPAREEVLSVRAKIPGRLRAFWLERTRPLQRPLCIPWAAWRPETPGAEAPTCHLGASRGRGRPLPESPRLLGARGVRGIG